MEPKPHVCKACAQSFECPFRPMLTVSFSLYLPVTISNDVSEEEESEESEDEVELCSIMPAKKQGGRP